MKKPRTKQAKIELANSNLRIGEKLFLAPYLILFGYVVKLDTLSFLIITILSFVFVAVAVKFKNDALDLYDEIYVEEEKMTKKTI